MPKLQKHSAWKRKEKEYSKWVITLPGSEVEKAGFKEGEELIAIASGPKQMFLASKDLEKILQRQTDRRKMSTAQKKYEKALIEYLREVMDK